MPATIAKSLWGHHMARPQPIITDVRCRFDNEAYAALFREAALGARHPSAA